MNTLSWWIHKLLRSGSNGHLYTTRASQHVMYTLFRLRYSYHGDVLFSVCLPVGYLHIQRGLWASVANNPGYRVLTRMCGVPNCLILHNIRWFIVYVALWFTVRHETIGPFHIMDALKPEPERPSDARSGIFHGKRGFPFELWILSIAARIVSSRLKHTNDWLHGQELFRMMFTIHNASKMLSVPSRLQSHEQGDGDMPKMQLTTKITSRIFTVPSSVQSAHMQQITSVSLK